MDTLAYLIFGLSIVLAILFKYGIARYINQQMDLDYIRSLTNTPEQRQALISLNKSLRQQGMKRDARYAKLIALAQTNEPDSK